jgi:hypothetical protein
VDTKEVKEMALQSKYVTSPAFRWRITSLGAGATYDLDLTDNDTKDDSNKKPKDFVPFNQITVMNLSSRDLELTLNGEFSILVPASAVRVWTDYEFWQVAIKNLDSANAIDGDVEIIIEKVISFQMAMRMTGRV